MIECNIIDDSNSSKSRPNSSRFPPITTHPKSATSTDRHIPLFSRSTSFDISYKRPKSSTGYKLADNELICLKHVKNSFPSLIVNESSSKFENNFNYGTENSNSKVSPSESDIERKSDYLIKLKNEMTEIRPLSPFEDFIDFADNNEENERLKKENESLKRNFMKMADIIRKYNQQISRKDKLILKLQQKCSFKEIESSNDCLTSFHQGYCNSYSQQNKPNNQSLKYRTDQEVFNALEQFLSESLNRSEDSYTTCDKLLEIFTTVIKKMILEFKTQLFQFNKTAEDMRKLTGKSLQIRNDSEIFDNQIQNDVISHEKTGDRLKELSSKYLELKESYEKLLNENNSFKSYVDYLCNLYRIETSEKSFNNINKLKAVHESLVESNQKLKLELNAIKETLTNEQEYIFSFIEIISEIELELELLGRNQKTLNHVITKFASKSDSFNRNQDCSCLLSLRNVLLQLYRNQFRWSQLLPDYSSISVNVSENTDDRGYDESDCQTNQTHNEVSYEKQVINQLQNCSHINAIKALASDSLDKTLADDIDTESINYILMTKSFNHNIHSNLEVVKEEEEEQINNEREKEEQAEKENEEEKTISELWYQDESEKNFTVKNTVLNDSANNSCDSIEFTAKQVLYDMIYTIDKSVNEARIKFNEKQDEQIESEAVEADQSTTFNDNQTLSTTDHSSQSPNQITELPIVKVNVIALNGSHFDDEKLDSAFASEDNCSSPEATNNIERCIHPIELDSGSKDITFNNLKMEEKNLVIRLRQLEAQTDLQRAELSSAHGRISQLESLLSDNSDNNFGQISTDKRQQSHQHLTDELNAWKELVQQQKAIMEKIRNELESTQLLVREKDKLIDALERPSSNTSNGLLTSEVGTQTIQSDDYNSIESDAFQANIVNKIVFNSNNDFDDEKFGLDALFNSLTNSDQFDKLNYFQDKQTDSMSEKSQNSLTDSCDDSYNDRENARLIPLAWTESDDHKMRSNASSQNSYYADNRISHIDHINDKSDESSYSTQSENLSKSISDQMHAKGFYTAYNLEERRRRHSCQGRVVSYGDHPRKPKLKLKNVEIVFNSKDKKRKQN